MKVYVIIYIVFLFQPLSSQEIFKDDTIKCWSKFNRLKWNDFLGQPLKVNVKYSLFDNDEAMAVSSISVYWENFYLRDSKVPCFIIINFFKKRTSWTKDTLYLELLEHEQIHFDISEVFVRKMRQGAFILNKKGATDMNVYENFIDSISKERDIFDNKFDKETHHGQVFNAQNRWRFLIDNELYKLKDYEVIDYKSYYENKIP